MSYPRLYHTGHGRSPKGRSAFLYAGRWIPCGSRSRPASVTCVIRTLGRQGMIGRCVAAPAVFDLPEAARPAGVAGPLVGVQGRRTPGAAITKSPCCAEPTPSRAWTGQIARSSPPWYRGCRGFCGGITWSHRARSCAGSGGWSPGNGPIPTISAVHPRRRGGRADRAPGHGESHLGIPENPG